MGSGSSYTQATKNGSKILAEQAVLPPLTQASLLGPGSTSYRPERSLTLRQAEALQSRCQKHIGLDSLREEARLGQGLGWTA